jgi:hypothetical protein
VTTKVSDQDDPHTKTLFRASLQKRTCHELLIALGFDRSPVEMGALSTVLVTALGSLSREAKADVVQFLSARPEQEPAPKLLKGTVHLDKEDNPCENCGAPYAVHVGVGAPCPGTV